LGPRLGTGSADHRSEGFYEDSIADAIHDEVGNQAVQPATAQGDGDQKNKLRENGQIVSSAKAREEVSIHIARRQGSLFEARDAVAHRRQRREPHLLRGMTGALSRNRT
jgi:hypothetical protein